MIEIESAHSNSSKHSSLKIILSPDRSLSWEGNKRVIWSLGAVCGGIALAFTIIAGTWVMLPFAGIEILTFASALYYVSWKLSYRHIISLDENTIIIEKGVYRPRGKWVWKKQDTRLVCSPPKHDWEAQSLKLVNQSGRVESESSDSDSTEPGNNETENTETDSVGIGEFLSQADANQLTSILQNEILVVTSL